MSCPDQRTRELEHLPSRVSQHWSEAASQMLEMSQHFWSLPGADQADLSIRKPPRRRRDAADRTGYPVGASRTPSAVGVLIHLSQSTSLVFVAVITTYLSGGNRCRLNLQVSHSQPQSIPPQTACHYESTERSQLELRSYRPQSCKQTQSTMTSHVVDCLSGSSHSRRI